MPLDRTTDLLIRARGLLERGWCRGVLARDKAGQRVEPTADTAVQWCAYGALYAAGMPIAGLHPAIHRLVGAIGGDGLIGFFNDRQETVEPILAAFDRSIAAGG